MLERALRPFVWADDDLDAGRNLSLRAGIGAKCAACHAAPLHRGSNNGLSKHSHAPPRAMLAMMSVHQ